MKLFDFFKKKKTDNVSKPDQPDIARADWTGKDFEFLIKGNVNISKEQFDSIMTPNSFKWEKISKNDWTFYKVGEDEFSYSWELPGIQFTFNSEVHFEKAKKIADEVIANILSTGQKAELIILEKNKVYKFN